MVMMWKQLLAKSSPFTRKMTTASKPSPTQQVRSTAASGSGVYESKRAVDEYLLFHYGTSSLLMPYSFGPVDALDFADRVAELASSKLKKSGSGLRALDVGCAVGGLSFALAGKGIDEVVGLDFSQHFIDAANEMKKEGRMAFKALKQGTIFLDCEAAVPSAIDRSRVIFQQGDACNLQSSLGQFDIIVASNLLCRLPKPKKFLQDVPAFLRPGGVLVLVSPYSWLEEYTEPAEWIGAREGGEESFAIVRELLGGNPSATLQLEHEEEVPFLIREHERKFQYGVSHGSVWRRLA